MNKEQVCCICGETFTGWGNDPWGAMWTDEHDNLIRPEFTETDKCCNKCNKDYVIPGRIYMIYQEKKQQKEI